MLKQVQHDGARERARRVFSRKLAKDYRIKTVSLSHLMRQSCKQIAVSVHGNDTFAHAVHGARN